MPAPPRLIRRLALGLVSVLLLLGLAVTASIYADGLLGRDRIRAVSNVKISSASAALRAYVARPLGPGPFPAVLMIHESWGLNADVVDRADALAREGYVVLAPDTFRGSTTSFLPRALYQVRSARADRVNSDVDAAYRWLAAQPDVSPGRIGIVGFGYGGRVALNYSLHNPALASTVTFYALTTANSARLRAIRSPVLGIFDGADRSIPLEEVREFQAALDVAAIPHQVTVYDGQPPASPTSTVATQRMPVQQAAWSEMLAFLEQTLKDQSTQPI